MQRRSDAFPQEIQRQDVRLLREPATTEDHVFARGFFVEARRDNLLPQQLAT
jgi:hypothetical protein